MKALKWRRCLVVALTVLLAAPACVKPPPTLTPAAVTAFNHTRVQKALDLIRDTVDDGSKTTPPVFSGATDRKVATWHESLITILHASGAGWKAAVLAGLNELPNELSASEKATLVPYLTLAKTVLNEVAP